MFVDEVDIHVAAGGGGRGCLSFRREKFIPRGGPDGGDGGHGGSVYIVATAHKNTLVDFRYHPNFEAGNGKHGQGSNKTGHSAEDLEIGVPVGTLVSDPAFAAELLNDGFSFVACGSDAGLLAKGADTLLSAVRDKII